MYLAYDMIIKRNPYYDELINNNLSVHLGPATSLSR